MAGYHDWITVPTLVCSSLSALATGTVIMMWIQSSNKDKWSFRYMLIINLTVAELINSWNNTLSGFQVLSTRSWLQPGMLCDVNGWVGQVSVQAADFSVLAIALTTLLTVHFNAWVLKSSRYEQYLVCALIWVVPLTTGTIALATNRLEPVSGNWCWISPEPRYLRYVLGHGWRFLIFAVVVGAYVSIFATVRKRLRARRQRPTGGSSGRGSTKDDNDNDYDDDDDDDAARRYSFSMYTEKAADVNVSTLHDELIRGKVTLPTRVREAVTRMPPSQRNRETGLEAAQEAKRDAQTRLGVRPRVRVFASSELDRDTRHWLLLSLFPLMYVIVWLPGIVNRIVEASGGHSEVLTALQAVTQLTGLVNALVYGFREHRLLHRRNNVLLERKSSAKSMDLDL